MTHVGSKLQIQIRDLRQDELRKSVGNILRRNAQPEVDRLAPKWAEHISVSGCRSLSKCLGHTFIELAFVGISLLSVTISEIEVFPVLVAILISGNTSVSHLFIGKTSSELTVVENFGFAAKNYNNT